MTAMQIIQQSEQKMQEILEGCKDELDIFVFAEASEYPAAQAFVSFALGRHFALRALTESEEADGSD